MENFVTISGCSSGGKSTLLVELRRRGFATIDEPGRRIVAEELKRGGRALPWVDAVARTTAPLPPAAAIHQCALAYASDMMLLDAALIPHGRTVFEKTIMAASLDHALWFHRPFRADEWLLYAQDSPNAAGGRGFARGLIFTRDGVLVASVAQEGLVRERLEKSP
jgi:acyl-CoA thioesterase II